MRSATAVWLAAFVALTLGACDGGDPVEEGPIVIGVIHDVGSEFQATAVDGARLAVSEINAAGGLLGGRQVELVFGNSENQGDLAREEARRLIDEEGAVAIIGMFGAFEGLAMAEFAEANSIPIMAVWGGSIPEWADANATTRYAYSLVHPDTINFYAAGEEFANNSDLGCTNVVAYVGFAEGAETAYVSEFESRFDGTGVNVLGTEIVVPDQADYAEIITPYVDSEVDCVVFYTEFFATIRRQWNELGAPETDTKFLSVYFPVPDDAIESGNRLTDMYVLDYQFANTETIAWSNYSMAHQAAFGSEPNPFSQSAWLYDMVAILGLSIETANSAVGADIQAEIESVSQPNGGLSTGEKNYEAGDLIEALDWIGTGKTVDYSGASGTVDLNPDGYAIRPLEMLRIVDWDTEDFEFIKIVRPDL